MLGVAGSVAQSSPTSSKVFPTDIPPHRAAQTGHSTQASANSTSGLIPVPSLGHQDDSLLVGSIYIHTPYSVAVPSQSVGCPGETLSVLIMVGLTLPVGLITPVMDQARGSGSVLGLGYWGLFYLPFCCRDPLCLWR